MLILLFLAVTSAASAEIIATSSILTYDVYGTYINPRPTEKQILWVSHICIVGYAIIMGVCAVIFHYIGISMGWLYEFMGTLLGSAVVPIALCISVKKANRMGCVVGCLAGFASGITGEYTLHFASGIQRLPDLGSGWLVATSKLNNGVINVETTGGDYEMLTGNLLSIGVGAIVSLTWTYLRPDDFDWEITRNMAITGHAPAVSENLEGADFTVDDTPFDDKHKSSMEKVDETVQTVASVDEEGLTTPEEIERAGLHKAFRFAAVSALLLTLIFLIVGN
ncbi:hypothetical protein QFC19_007867 [Naganishia cerealis]|uniref:Uncharacterized protein n=1 Tax=Naganishia cerealis TaxID=610337 RepID=A0ACC2V665_9TREE|nr:hypothetical protein QFC19_007867 [Naganishia cerealis]